MSENQPESSYPLDNPAILSGLRLAIVASRFNEKLVNMLIEDALKTFTEAGIPRKQIKSVRVPGAYELPFAVNQLCQNNFFDVILALGVVIGGDTKHHEVIGHSVAHAFQRIAIDRSTPIINGVIVTDDPATAQARCIGDKARGIGLAQSALAMAVLEKEVL